MCELQDIGLQKCVTSFTPVTMQGNAQVQFLFSNSSSLRGEVNLIQSFVFPKIGFFHQDF